MRPNRAVASFDSASTFLRVLARHLRGQDSPALGLGPAARAAAHVLPFVEANPGVAVHHMHDANQDRLMIQHMGYLRFKYRDLPAAYRDFLRECLEPGGTVLIVDCAEHWPTTKVGPRQVFQHGAVGGMEAREYRSKWDGPVADGERPEAEWGFDPALLDDLTRLCANENWSLERLTFPRADAISGTVADMYRAWYDERGVPANRLLVGGFALIDVHLPLARGLVPYWTLFGTDPARHTLEAYLRDTEPYDEIHLGLFSHGTCSIGLATIEEWETVLRQALRRGAYCGVDPDVYPQDFASNHRFHARAAALPASGPAPGPASWPWVHRWLPALRLGNPTRVTT